MIRATNYVIDLNFRFRYYYIIILKSSTSLLLLMFTNTPLFPIYNNGSIQFSMARTKRKFSEFTPIEKNPDTKRARQNRANLIAGKKRKRQNNEDDNSKRKKRK